MECSQAACGPGFGVMDTSAHRGSDPHTIADFPQPETSAKRAHAGERSADCRQQHAVGPTITLAYDKSSANAQPILGQRPSLSWTSVLLGLFFIVESFGPFLVGASLVSSPQTLAVVGLTTQGGLQTAMLLQLVVGANLLLFASGTDNKFFLPACPAAPLFLLLLLAQVATMLMCATGTMVEPISWQVIGWVWVYNLVWLVILRGIWLTGERVAAFLAARQLDSGGVPLTAADTPASDRGGRLRPYLIGKDQTADDHPSLGLAPLRGDQARENGALACALPYRPRLPLRLSCLDRTSGVWPGAAVTCRNESSGDDYEL